ncbi:hypothetical protein AAEI01_21180, partial [Shewanella xiamenensis]
MVGRVTGVKAIAAIGVERKAIDRIGEAERECVTRIHIRGDHLSAEFVAIFADRLALRGEHWHIVRADDIDGNCVSGAVGAMYGEAVVQELAFAKLLDLSLAVVDAVAPIGLAVGLRGQNKAAVTAQARALLGWEEAFATVHIAHAEMAFDGGVQIFLDLAGRAVIGEGCAVVGAGERNRQVRSASCASAVGHCDGDRQCLGLASGQMLVGRIARVKVVAAIGVQGEAIDRIGETKGECITDIHIRGNHLSAELGAIFTDGLALRSEHWCVIAASEGHGDGMIGAIGAGNGEAVGERGTGFELLDSGLAVVGAVVPLAVGVEAERTITARHIGLCGEMVLTRIRVTDCQLPMGFELACRQVGVFSDCAAIDTCNHGAIIMAVDGDGDFVCRAVHRLHGQAVGQRGVLAKGLNRTVLVVQRIGPVAIGCQREAAVAARGLGLRREGRLLVVDVGDRELATSCELGVFGDRTGICAANDCAIVAACECNRQIRSASCASVVGDCDGDRERLSLASGQMLISRIGWIEAVAAIGVERKASRLGCGA